MKINIRKNLKQSNRIKQLFDEYSSSYDKHMEDTMHVKAQKEIIFEFLKSIKGKVLDIGTGTGTIPSLISEKNNLDIYGIDFSNKMIECAKQKLKKSKQKSSFLVADALQIPFKSNSFDIITCSYIMPWLYYKNIAMMEIIRLLKKQGIVILLEEDLKNSSEPIFTKMNTYLKYLKKLTKYINMQKIKKLMYTYNFELLKEVRKSNDQKHDSVGLLYKIKNNNSK